jgi:multiple sugar transport system substrate-binding protein
MFSIKALAKVSAGIAAAGLFVLSLRGPAEVGTELSMLMEPDGTGVWHDLIDEFQMLHPDITVRLIEGPPATNTREDMYATSFLSGSSGYDIVYCDVIWVPKFAAAGWLLDLTDRPSASDLEDYLPADLRAGTYRGRLYRIPGFSDAGVLYYRKDLVQQPPDTFDDLVRLSNQHRSADLWGWLWQGRQYEGLVTVYLEILWGHGGDWIDADTRAVGLDRPEALQALQFLKNTIGKISPAAVTTYIEEDTRNLFQNGRSVFLRNWPYVWTLLRNSTLRTEDRVGVTPVVRQPGHERAATLGGWGFAISKFTQDPEAAWQFVQFLSHPEQLRRVQSRMGRIPARKSLVPPEFVPILDSARMRPPIPEYAQASDILQRWLSAALTGRTDPEEALRTAARETRLLLGTPLQSPLPPREGGTAALRLPRG